jgi:hypothetical protein
LGTAERDQLVAALEKFTQALRDGLVLVQEAMVSTKVSVDDWLLTTLSLTYAERKEAAEASAIAATGPIRELYGAKAWPVEIRKVS